jgi:hypothetical protein
MKNKKINLLGNHNRYVYIVARKLRKGEVIFVPETGQCPKVTSSDWGFSSVHNTMLKAEETMKQHIEISRQFKEKDTYGIISIVNGSLVLLKSERA